MCGGCRCSTRILFEFKVSVAINMFVVFKIIALAAALLRIPAAAGGGAGAAGEGAGAAAGGGPRLVVAVNGLPLSGAPFLDRAHTWPPRLTWQITAGGGAEDGGTVHDADDAPLTQVAFAVTLDGARVVSRAGPAARHTLPAPVRSNAARRVSVATTLSDGTLLRASGAFRTALLSPRDDFGNAAWISGGTLLQRDLTELVAPPSSGATVVNATAFASGVGCFSMTLGGQRVSNSWMDPGWATLPTVRVTYRAFDVTDLIGAAAAAAATTTNTAPLRLRVALGMCKYGYQNSFCVGGHAATDVCKAFLMSLQVAYSDGTTRTVATSATDGTWSATTSANPIRYAHLYHGEQYDGRVTDTPAQWHPATAATFDTGENGGTAVDAAHALGTPALLTMPPLEVGAQYTPVSVAPVPNVTGAWVFDMGDNLAGFAALSLPRAAFVADQPVTLKYAEVMRGDGSGRVLMAWCGGGEGPACRCGGINCANQTDTFYPAPPANDGAGAAADRVTYVPTFTYHGFRYVQLEGLAPAYVPSAAADLIGLFVRSAVRRTGNVSFDHPVLDGVQQAIVQTQLSNLHFHPTDCPQREKRGWTGDAQFTSRQAALNFDMRQLYASWLQTMADHDQAGCATSGAAPVFPQANKDICCNPKHGSFGCDYTGIPNGTFTHTSGSVADVVPFMYVGGWPGDPSWGSITSVLPFSVWKSGADDGLLAGFYDAARRNVDFFAREAAVNDGLLIEFGYYGDWLSLTPTAKPQVTSLAQILATRNLVLMAAHLGKASDAASYNVSLTKLRAAYHAKYWDAAAHSYHGGSQTANLMPLILGIPPPAARAQAAAAFVAKVEAAGNATDSGLVGASYVLQALVQAGRGDIALAMAMREEKPSWGFMVKQGPGTIWETWDDSTNSHNHPMFTASIGPYLYSITGLDPTTWSVSAHLASAAAAGAGAADTHAEEEITVHLTPDPHAVRVLGQASGRVMTQCGEVSVAWRARGDSFAMNATMPHNCGRARLQMHVVGAAAAAQCCVSGFPVHGGPDDATLPRHVFRVDLAPDGTTVDVVVGGGRSHLVLAPCA